MSTPRLRPSSIRIKADYAREHHLGPVSTAQLKRKIEKTAELTRVVRRG